MIIEKIINGEKLTLEEIEQIKSEHEIVERVKDVLQNTVELKTMHTNCQCGSCMILQRKIELLQSIIEGKI